MSRYDQVLGQLVEDLRSRAPDMQVRWLRAGGPIMTVLKSAARRIVEAEQELVDFKAQLLYSMIR